jgi:hypothetical protein
MEYLEKCRKEQEQRSKKRVPVPKNITFEESGTSQQRNRYGIPATSPVPKS